VALLPHLRLNYGEIATFFFRNRAPSGMVLIREIDRLIRLNSHLEGRGQHRDFSGISAPFRQSPQRDDPPQWPAGAMKAWRQPDLFGRGFTG